MAITSDEVNFLVYRYLQESGFLHSAFTFAYESQLAKSSVINTELPPGALVSFMQKGLQYVGIEAHINEDGTERECDGDFSLLSPHICRVAQSASSSARSFKASNKRKRKGDGSPDAVDGTKAEMNGVDKLDKEALVLLNGHEKEVYACSWNPVKNILVSGSSDSTARVWSLPNKVEDSKAVVPKVLNHGTGPHKDVTTLEWNHDGSLLASGTYNGKTRIWNDEGEMKHIFQYHNGPVFATRWSKTSLFLLSASFDKTVVVWDATTETKKQQLKLHEDPILDASWKDDSTFATCSSDMSICVARVGETKADLVLRGHKDAINSVKWDPSGRYLASCSDDYTVKIWDPSKAVKSKDAPEGDAMEVDSNENSKKDAEDDAASAAALVYTLQEHKKEVYTFRWSCTGPGTALPDQPLTLASASFDGTVKLWDAESGSCRRTFDHQYPVYGVAFSPDGEYLASGTVGGMVNVWSLKDGSLVKTYQANGDIYEVNWNKQGDQIAACVSSGDVAIINFRL
ncbi:F-box-like/WD repeat-containing protein [Phytophthora rubi]|uniref:F-box-like/WD repeat-containing protein n=1 Tax=Phytophthora rubi TaxID=129364 RepID=A0A6A3NFE1_9STRA|nr:F-box-like/WD repeat-containing protein [Phytophthora rubi]KAE9042042.1 F-box-like/WD repeat-containing protein [Phytophthora rubi]KAE9348046.1 F-box-like/WD repeat-containing protein [Phytophthora rubi]